jgi:hypothetical protein
MMKIKRIPENKEKLISLYAALLVNFLLSLSLASSLGVSPADSSIYFKPNTTIELDFNIINSESNSFEATLGGYGEIKDLMFFENSSLQIKGEDYRIPFKLILKLPSEMEPGIHRGLIKITPLFEAENQGTVAAYISPQIPVVIKVPYPSKYADVSLVVLEIDEGTPLPLYVKFDNLGSEDILRAGANIELYDYEGKLIITSSTPEISVIKSSVGTTRAEPGPVLKKGLYRAAVKAYYDEFNKTLEANLSVGEPVIRIKELLTKELSPNGINKVAFKVYNEWNTELSITGFLRIDEKENEIARFNLGKEEGKEITGFIDTAGLEPGDHVLSISLNYEGQSTTEMFPVTISEKAAKPEKLFTTPVIIILAILIFVIIALVSVLIIKKKKKEQL